MLGVDYKRPLGWLNGPIVQKRTLPGKSLKFQAYKAYVIYSKVQKV